ncbi:MAG: hypothetical protein U0470_06015 [Anaerolineae bacterium]
MWAARGRAGSQEGEPLLVDLEFRNDGDLVIGLPTASATAASAASAAT